MTREEKHLMVEDLQNVLAEAPVVYLTDASGLDSAATTQLRRECFKNDIVLRVVKNTLLKIAMERTEGKDFSPLFDEALKGQTAMMTASVGNAPAKLIKEFRKKQEKPLLKGAYIEEACFVGDDKLNALSELKSKEEVIGDIIALLQSPAKNVLSALQSGGSNIAGLVKTLSERES
ncbi:MAG: 50S ribosomal protein L10 [Flavobacteriales bacterium]|nr:50S ribosomal protein L10 [Flavobacteriales bacterium]MDG1780377.1 50S ribosomal protein L10 [Flavobacteriales bacterium]MDG2246573.1 50S ribosomal protein L10 [Flavobacteriales bacterium]